MQRGQRIWEIAIKASLGKLELGARLEPDFHRRSEENGFTILRVESTPAAHMLNLPWHHRDPFDRLLVAQAQLEQLALISHGSQLDAYGIKRIW